MLNSVSIIATLKEVDEKNPCIRNCVVQRPYASTNQNYLNDIVPLMNWNKLDKGEIFTFKMNSLVAIKGRIENYNQRVVVIVEEVMYLGTTIS